MADAAPCKYECIRRITENSNERVAKMAELKTQLAIYNSELNKMKALRSTLLDTETTAMLLYILDNPQLYIKTVFALTILNTQIEIQSDIIKIEGDKLTAIIYQLRDIGFRGRLIYQDCRNCR